MIIKPLDKLSYYSHRETLLEKFYHIELVSNKVDWSPFNLCSENAGIVAIRDHNIRTEFIDKQQEFPEF